MRVQATRQGFYDQVLREPGEVFDLVNGPDGEMPIRMKRLPSLDGTGKVIEGEWTEEVWLDEDGNAVHADFAPATTPVKGKGAFKGESFSPGWMVQVPDETPLGIYEADVVFAMDGKQKPVPIQRIIKSQNEPTNMPRMSPMRGRADRPHRRV